MQKFKSYFLLKLVLPFLLAGCHSCDLDHKTSNNSTRKYVKSKWTLHENMPTHFSYRSSLLVTLIDDDETKDLLKEDIIIERQNNKTLFNKKIKDKEIKLFFDQDTVMAKNNGGAWRIIDNDHFMHNELLHDGLNLLPWLLDSIGIKPINKSSYKLDQAIDLNAPLIKNLRSRYEQLSMMHSAKVVGNITPIESKLKITIMTSTIGIEMHASTKLTEELEHDVAKPVIKDHPISHIPVNLSTRFKAMLDEESSTHD